MLTSNFVRSLSVPRFTTVFVASAVLRIVLILYSEWHDARSVVKYTDIDYRVFSDAARFVSHPTENNKAQGPFGAYVGLGRCVFSAHPLYASMSILNSQCFHCYQPVYSRNLPIHTAPCTLAHPERMAAPIVRKVPLRNMRPPCGPADAPFAGVKNPAFDDPALE